MHVLVATDGRLDPAEVARFAKPLAGEGGQVTVLTVVEIPRQLLRELRSQMGELPEVDVDIDVEYVEPPTASTGTPRGWPGDDAMIARYLEDKRVQYTQPLVDALVAAGVNATGVVVESEDPAKAILAESDDRNVDVVLIGAHGQGFFEGLLGSTGTKVVRRSHQPVLVLKN